jgi:solute:Na+ symporter, SSS family
VGESSILSLVSLFIPLAFGLYWKRSTASGAILAMISGILTWIVFKYVIATDIPPLVPGVLVSMLLMVGGSLYPKRPRN